MTDFTWETEVRPSTRPPLTRVQVALRFCLWLAIAQGAVALLGVCAPTIHLVAVHLIGLVHHAAPVGGGG